MVDHGGELKAESHPSYNTSTDYVGSVEKEKCRKTWRELHTHADGGVDQNSNPSDHKGEISMDK